MSPYVLIAVIVVMLAPPEPLLDPPELGRRGLAALLLVAAVAFLSEALSVWTARRLQRQFDRRQGTLRLAGWLDGLLQVAALGLFVVLLHVCQWNSVGALFAQRYLWSSQLVAEAIALAPYLLAKGFTFASWFRVERTLRQMHLERGHDLPGFPNGWQFVSFQMRSACGLFVALPLLRAGLEDAIRPFKPSLEQSPLWSVSFDVAAVALLLLAAPWLLRVLWNARSLPAGALRTELEQLGARVGYRCSDVLIWPTARGMVNAVVTGFVPQLRYVMLTDALIDQVPRPEIKAIFGHELGHVRHRHLAFLLGFLLGAMLVISMLAAPLRQWLIQRLPLEYLQWFAFVERQMHLPLDLWLYVPVLLLCLGWLSRQFERQADVYGCRVASLVASGDAALPNPRQLPVTGEGVRLFSDALGRVAELNGIDINQYMWRHGSIAQRLRFLDRLIDDPTLADRFDRATGRLRWALVLGLVVAAALLWQPSGGWNLWLGS